MTLPFSLRRSGAVVMGLAIALSGCGRSTPLAYRTIQLHQQWQLSPGMVVAGHQVLGSLGDISLDLSGSALYAPWPGKVEAHTPDCVLYSSPELPAYLFRLCGLERQRLGDRRAGEVIGRSQVLRLATLRRQPDGTWAIVEPSLDVITPLIQAP